MRNSLRWRLQVWHTTLLSLVIASFGTTLYLQSRQTALARFDAELHAAARVLEGSLRGVPARQLRVDKDGDIPGDRRRRAEASDGERVERALTLPETFRNVRSNEPAPYFMIWLEDGTPYRGSGAPRDLPVPQQESLPSGTEVAVRTRGSLREVLLVGPQGTRILVGQDAVQDLQDLHRLAWQITLSGGTVLLLGMLGGWFSSRRVLAPIPDMSAAASQISSTNLHRRLTVSETAGELHDLALILNRAFDRMQEAVEAQAQFTADASHELRTPVSVILAQTELALSRDRSGEAYRDALQACHRAARRMQEVIASLLSLARLDAAGVVRTDVQTDLSRAAEEAVEMLRPLADELGIALDLSLPSTTDPLLVDGEVTHLQTVLANLISNAIFHNRPQGRVTVTVATREEWALVTVADTGPAIATEDLPKIFHRFFRGDPARSRPAGSSGLGLAISLAITQKLGGRIEVTSTVDVGSTFRLQLPRRR